ncbi:hypothetical protein PCE1_003105 [Barthelona sp. PCE]
MTRKVHIIEKNGDSIFEKTRRVLQDMFLGCECELRTERTSITTLIACVEIIKKCCDPESLHTDYILEEKSIRRTNTKISNLGLEETVYTPVLHLMLELILSILGVIVFVVLIFLRMGAIIVRQSEKVVIEKFGSFHKVLDSGFHWFFPGIYAKREKIWTKYMFNAKGKLIEYSVSDFRIDMREQVFRFDCTGVYTNDGARVNVQALLYYRVNDAQTCMYEISDLQSALAPTAQTLIKESFGKLSFIESLSCQEFINSHIESWGAMFSKWGIYVERLEIIEIDPTGQVLESMSRQLFAERDRRGRIAHMSGESAKMQLVSEGSKVAAANMGIAEAEVSKKTSQGESEATIIMAQADIDALEVLHQAISVDENRSKTRATNFLIAQNYLDMIKFLGQNKDLNKTIYFPYPVELSGAIKGVTEQLSNIRREPTLQVPITQTEPEDEFDDLN